MIEKICNKCNAKLIDGAEFCHACGAKNEKDIEELLDYEEGDCKLCERCCTEIKGAYSICPECGFESEGIVNVEPTVEVITDTSAKQPQRKKVAIIGSGVAILSIAFILIMYFLNMESPLVRVYDELGTSMYWELSSDESYLRIDTNPYDIEDSFSLEAWELIIAVQEKLDLPESLEAKMGETRSMDGRLSEDYGKITVSWTYHPDDGIEVMYELNN